MARNITMNQLTEGIRDRHLGAERNRLVEKWSRTGLLRGMEDIHRETMSQLLENQAAQLLREANTLGAGGGDVASTGNVNGFSNIAFPIVRRVFGGLVANDLVSIQPMSLPSGLLFYLDYSYGSDIGGQNDLNADQSTTKTDATFQAGDSLYGSPSGRAIRQGADAVGGMYDLAGSSYSKVHNQEQGFAVAEIIASGAYGSGTTIGASTFAHATGSDGKLLQFDPQITSQIEAGTHNYHFVILDGGTSTLPNLDVTNIKSLALTSDLISRNSTLDDGAGKCAVSNEVQPGLNILNVRRLNQVGEFDESTNVFTANPFVAAASRRILCVVSGAHKETVLPTATHAELALRLSASYAIADAVSDTVSGEGAGSTLTIPSFESETTRKLRARWSPELAQDLNAYHSLDAEVELTQILSEQIALELDREILNDLLMEARGANFFWSRSPGKFVNKRTGVAQQLANTLQIGPQFTGTVREWYETLVETIIDVANEIHRKTLRGSANFIVVSPEVATIFEASVLYKPTIKIDGQGQTGPEFSIGAQAIGSLSNRFTVYKDPYFPRNKILVGYKGGSYLETGYVYAPYVPLIVTPTIFAPEDFTPRKGVMTRYGKKMVRADFYGTVTCLDMDVI
jgi:hypothetical protein